MHVFVRPEAVSRHLGRGRVSSVLKAAALGVPILYAHGILPLRSRLSGREQTMGQQPFSYFHTGIRSGFYCPHYALLDPVMTVGDSAGLHAAVCGIAENMLVRRKRKSIQPDLRCPVDNCCDGVDCLPEVHKGHHTFSKSSRRDLATPVSNLGGYPPCSFWIASCGVITTLIPSELMTKHLGEGFQPC